jgi:hypothetical protein
MEQVTILYNTIKNLNQFDKSQLQDAIMKVFKCDYATAFAAGKFHCNAISLYGILFAKGFYSGSYADFLSFLLSKGMLGTDKSPARNGYINARKPDIFKALKINASVFEYKGIPDARKIGDMYQVSINGLHHFVAAAVHDDMSVHLYDTHAEKGVYYRGEYGGEITAALAKHGDKMDWMKVIA